MFKRTVCHACPILLPRSIYRSALRRYLPKFARELLWWTTLREPVSEAKGCPWELEKCPVCLEIILVPQHPLPLWPKSSAAGPLVTIHHGLSPRPFRPGRKLREIWPTDNGRFDSSPRHRTTNLTPH